jgi:hypothetical protein
LQKWSSTRHREIKAEDWNDHIPAQYGNRPINPSRLHFSSINPPPLGFVAQKVREAEDAAFQRAKQSALFGR